jgi:hypothetical protein
MHYKLEYIFSQMKPAQILFEKVISISNVSNDDLIQCSEKRRSFMNAIYFGNDIYKYGVDYYNHFNDILPKLRTSTLNHQPLFQWNNKGSSCWLFEKVHLENQLMLETWKMAIQSDSAKETRSTMKECIQYGIRALDTLNQYTWEDTSILSMETLQDRYYLYHICKAGSQYYKAMNEFSVSTKGESNAKCTRLAYEFMDTATLLWKSDVYDKQENTILKSKYLLQLANNMDMDACGEKCGLLKSIMNEKNVPKQVKDQYDIWKQQNDQVYFQEEKTTKTIDFSPLTDLFQNLRGIVE